MKIPMNEIYADADFNCRGVITPFDVIDLAKSIQEQGLLQPITVQPYKGPHGEKYRVVMGHRRHMAHQVNNALEIECIVRDDLDDATARILNLSENLNREELNMVQEANAIKPLYREAGLTQQEIADKLGKSRGWVQNRVYLLDLPKQIQDEVAAGWLSSEHIKAMRNLPLEDQFAYAKEVKTAKQNAEGKRVRVKGSKALATRNIDKPFARDRAQIERMIDHLFESLGKSNFGTRCLAWAAGNISSSELFADIKKIADEMNISYYPPEEDV